MTWAKRTLNSIAGLIKQCLVDELGLVYDWSSFYVCTPVHDLARITSYPLRANVTVELDWMCLFIIGGYRNCHVGERKRVVDQILGLSDESRSYHAMREKSQTSTGLRKLTVRSTGPAASMKILWVEVIWVRICRNTGVYVRTEDSYLHWFLNRLLNAAPCIVT